MLSEISPSYFVKYVTTVVNHTRVVSGNLLKAIITTKRTTCPVTLTLIPTEYTVVSHPALLNYALETWEILPCSFYLKLKLILNSKCCPLEHGYSLGLVHEHNLS